MAMFHSYVNLPEGKLMVLNYELITTVATVSKHVKKKCLAVKLINLTDLYNPQQWYLNNPTFVFNFWPEKGTTY